VHDAAEPRTEAAGFTPGVHDAAELRSEAAGFTPGVKADVPSRGGAA
jgi:hypothetical protein